MPPGDTPVSRINEEGRYRVGDLIVDPGRGRVTRGDQEIPLPKLSYDLLLVLTRAAPNLLSIDVLMNKVWPGLVVTPETVSQRVKLLRDALGDDSKAPRYIGGLRGRGYQLVADVVPDAAMPVGARAGTPLVAANPQPRPQSPMARFGALAAVVLGAVAIGIGIYQLASGPDREAASLHEEAQAVRDAVPAAANAQPFSPPPRSVAVLAFANLSGNRDEEYFSDGLSEELIHVLTRIQELRVAARTSSFTFKGANADIPTVGRRLNVAAVLEGSVRRSGERVRITAQLINSRDGYHLWSETYDSDLQDILGLQTDIARKVAEALKVTLVDDVRQQLQAGGTSSPLAFDAYLRGRYGQSIQDEAGLRAALAALDEAIGLDPGYANALSFRARVLDQLGGLWVEDGAERARLQAEARASAEKAVAMAPGSGTVHAALGEVLSTLTTDYPRMDAAYRRAIELEPGNAGLLVAYASFASQFGRADALEAARRAQDLDPLRAGVHANLGVALFYARRHDEARAAFREANRLGTNRLTINWLGMNELAAGRPGEALLYCERDPDFAYDQLCLAMAYHRLGRREDAVAMLQKLQAGQGDSAAYQYAEIHAWWGESAEALRWLNRAVQLHDAGLLAIRTDPYLDPIRDTPQFRDIVDSLDLPD